MLLSQSIIRFCSKELTFVRVYGLFVLLLCVNSTPTNKTLSRLTRYLQSRLGIKKLEGKGLSSLSNTITNCFLCSGD